MKKPTKLTQLLEDLDMFGQPILFYIKGKTKFKTSFGGIITIIMLMIMTIVSINSLVNLRDKSKMKSTQQTIYELNPPYLNLTKENFMFSIGIDDKTITLNNSIFDFTASVYSQNQTDNESKTSSIILRPCQPEDYADAIYVSRINFGNNFCPENFSYPIYGAYSDAIYQSIIIHVHECINGTNPNVTCASSDFIKEYIKKNSHVPVTLNFINKVIDLQNQTDPFKVFVDRQSWGINPFGQLQYNTNLFFRSNQLLSYDNLLGIPTPNIYTGITYEREREDNVLISTDESKQLARFNLYSSNYQNYHTRTYDDLLTLLSFLGGIMNLLGIACGLIVSIFNNFKFKLKMLNELYDFDLKDHAVVEKNSQNSTHEINESQGSSNRAPINARLDYSIVKQKFDNMKNLRGRLTFSLTEFLKYICCCCKSKLTNMKIELFYLANTQLAKDMDILWLIKRIQEMDKLKSVLLYPDKLKIFEFVSPPVISVDSHLKFSNEIVKYMRRNTLINYESGQPIQLSKLDNRYKNLDQYYKYYDIYNNLKNMKEPISQNIIKSLDQEIAQIFECIEKLKNSNDINRAPPKIKEFPTFTNLQSSFANNGEDQKQNIEAKAIIVGDSGSNLNSPTKNCLEELEISIDSQISNIKQERDEGRDHRKIIHESVMYELQNQHSDHFNSFSLLYTNQKFGNQAELSEVKIRSRSQERGDLENSPCFPK